MGTGPDGWLYWSTGKATVALIIRDGRVVECPPYARRWALGKDARELWRVAKRQGVRIEWFADAPTPAVP